MELSNYPLTFSFIAEIAIFIAVEHEKANVAVA